METKDEIKIIAERAKTQLSDFFDGNSWVTENFKKKVFSIKPDKGLKKISGHSHSVAELVEHMSAWRNFVVQKLIGNDAYDIEDESEVNWPVSNDWIKTCSDFEICHQNLLAAIENFPIDDWTTKVPGRNYSFLYLLNGIIQHDYYHYGQIGSLLAAIRKIEGM